MFFQPRFAPAFAISTPRKAGLAVTSYCGMAIGQVFSDDVLKEMAAIQGLARPDSRIVDPRGLAPDWDSTEPR